MLFTYVASGGLGVTGCVPYFKWINYTYRWAEGATAYAKGKAKNGYLEVVVIKRVKLLTSMYGKVYPIYVDTYNSLWMDSQLCSEKEAIEFAEAFYARNFIGAENELNELCG